MVQLINRVLAITVYIYQDSKHRGTFVSFLAGLWHAEIKYTEVRFASFLSGGFIIAILVNPLERILAKRTSVKCTVHVANV